MIKDIKWSKRAEMAYGHIIDYVADEFGTTRAQKYIFEVAKEVNKLKANPELGQKEPWLDGSRYEFRRLIIGQWTKVIYRVAGDCIEIADVWDVRQDPETLAARLEQ